MPTISDFMARAEAAESKAASLAEGFDRDELLRRAAAYREIVAVLREQEDRNGAGSASAPPDEET